MFEIIVIMILIAINVVWCWFCFYLNDKWHQEYKYMSHQWRKETQETAHDWFDHLHKHIDNLEARVKQLENDVGVIVDDDLR